MLRVTAGVESAVEVMYDMLFEVEVEFWGKMVVEAGMD